MRVCILPFVLAAISGSVLSKPLSIPGSPAPASPSPTSIPMAAKRSQMNFADMNFAEQERTRALGLLRGPSNPGKGLSSPRQLNVPLTNQYVIYTIDVGIGSPPTTYNLIVSTGSANTWVGAEKPYDMTSSSHDTNAIVSVDYGNGYRFTGEEWTDTVTITPERAIQAQSIGVAEISQGFSGVDGVLGLGPTDLTLGTVIPDGSAVPTVIDNLYTQGAICQPVFGLYFQPTINEVETTGVLTLGGPDPSLINSPINYVPVSSTSPADRFYSVDLSIQYGNVNGVGTPLLCLSAAIVDSATTLLFLDTDAFNSYVSLTGAIMDQQTGLLSLTDAQYENLQSLFFNIGTVAYELTPNAQLWPRALNADIGGAPDGNYLIVADLGESGSDGVNVFIGYTFLQRFYSLYDATNNQVGFATTAHTYDQTN